MHSAYNMYSQYALPAMLHPSIRVRQQPQLSVSLIKIVTDYQLDHVVAGLSYVIFDVTAVCVQS